MASSLSKNTFNDDNIINVISSDKFGDFTPDMQQEILNKLDIIKQRDGGIVGKLFGCKKELASMNVAFVICALLMLAGVFVGTQEFWNGILPVIGAALGYIFGKGGGKEE